MIAPVRGGRACRLWRREAFLSIVLLLIPSPAFLHPPPPPPNPYRMGLDHPTATTSMDHMRNVGHACHTVRLQGVSKLIEKRNITSHLERSDKPHGPSCKHLGAILGSLGAILTVLEAILSVSEASWAV